MIYNELTIHYLAIFSMNKALLRLTKHLIIVHSL